MQVEILGRVRLSGPDGPVRLTELEHGLLALAALRGRIGVDSLGEWLWDGDPPSSARNRVQSLVSGIRRKASTDVPVIVTDGRGYRLGDAVDIDVTSWTDEVATARAERVARPGVALVHYDRALGVFRHEPLQGTPDTGAVEVERSRLSQERLSVLEERHDAALRAGALDGLVAELDALTAQHPYHEGFIAQFMLALAASGQQSRALEVFRAARTRLDEELGVRPSDQLTEAQRVVLSGEADPPAPRTVGEEVLVAVHGLPVPRTLPRRPPSFVGRDDELQEILSAAGEVDRDAVVVAVTGLPGSGKSALALEAGHRLRDAFPDGALYHDGANTPGGLSVDAVIASFLPLLGVHPEAVPSDPRSRAGLFRSLLDGRRMLVVVDNLVCPETAAEAGGCVLSDLLPAGPGGMAIIASRKTVPGLSSTRRIRLRSLRPGPAKGLLETLVGPERLAEEPEATADVLRLTGRMPLGLRLVAGRLAQRPDLTLADVADRLVEPAAGDGSDGMAALRDGLDRILADLAPAAQWALEGIAHLPMDTVSGWVLGAALDDVATGDAVLDVLAETGLVETVLREGHDPQFRLHDLVRAHIRARTDGDPAVAGRLRTGAVRIAQAAVVRAGALLGTLPQRFIPPAPRPSDLEAVAPTRPVRAGRRFFRTETPMLLALAVELAPDHPHLAWRLLSDAALGTAAATDVHAWFEAEQRVRPHLADADEDGRLGSALLLLCRAWLLQDRRSASGEAAGLAEDAHPRLVALGAHAAAAAAALVVAQAATSTGLRARAEEAIATADASLANASDPVLSGWSAIARGTVHNDYDEVHDAAREFTRAREILVGTPHTVAFALATLELSRARRRTGDLGAATILIDEALSLLDDVGAVHMYSYALDARAEVSLAGGQAPQALDEAGRALERALTSRDAFLGARARRTYGRALFALGRLDAAEAALRQAVLDFSELDRPLSVAFSYQVLAAVLDASGRPDEARAARVEEVAASRRATAARPVAQRRSPGPA
ncbi:hypothetical protein JQN72_17045 [Phycicoccus sp. CSK15P-2]|uniref:AfsR/SARP family transcriptional regulator n=1 Tax=Phycicoccus sp. CSK15P-2 TaxID=2807627 RepID=UPI00195114A2|nr:BTAD domain-containing putative transcriptional regulator [Phycicoccus sp. CSK15P-2]MBM6405951.1 hypothetical protein [Phycicoccus sp. CSK15P-2]